MCNYIPVLQMKIISQSFATWWGFLFRVAGIRFIQFISGNQVKRFCVYIFMKYLLLRRRSTKWRVLKPYAFDQQRNISKIPVSWKYNGNFTSRFVCVSLKTIFLLWIIQFNMKSVILLQRYIRCIVPRK